MSFDKACRQQVGWTLWVSRAPNRDGRISNITEALLNLVPPNANISTLKKDFQQSGLNVKDLVVLSGTQTPCNIWSVFG